VCSVAVILNWGFTAAALAILFDRAAAASVKEMVGPVK
jgi:hypothetical protein